MKIEEAVNTVSSKFVYVPDRIKIFDSWSVMKDMHGDCDNFALTCIWYACDKSLLKFFLYVLILHKYRFWFCKTKSGGKHVVGYAQGKFFDNFTNKAMDKESFFAETGHKRYFVYPSVIVVIYMVIGLFI